MTDINDLKQETLNDLNRMEENVLRLLYSKPWNQYDITTDCKRSYTKDGENRKHAESWFNIMMDTESMKDHDITMFGEALKTCLLEGTNCINYIDYGTSYDRELQVYWSVISSCEEMDEDDPDDISACF